MITNFNTTLSTFHNLFEQNGKIPQGWKVGFPISCSFADGTEFSQASLSKADCFYISWNETIILCVLCFQKVYFIKNKRSIFFTLCRLFHVFIAGISLSSRKQIHV